MYGILLAAVAKGLESAVLPFLEWLAKQGWHVVEAHHARREAQKKPVAEKTTTG